MSQDRQLRIYRALTGLYPRSIRDDYREDMAILFSHQINDESPTRVWARTIRDLAVTVPAHHSEAAMHGPPTLVLVGICSVVAASALALALLLGTGGTAVTIVFLMVAVVAGGTGASAWRAQQPIHDADSFDAVWWKFLIAGVTLVAANVRWHVHPMAQRGGSRRQRLLAGRDLHDDWLRARRPRRPARHRRPGPSSSPPATPTGAT